AQKTQHILTAKIEQRMLDQARVKSRQPSRVPEHDVGGIFALAAGPVIFPFQGTANFFMQRMTAVQQTLQMGAPRGLQLPVQQGSTQRRMPIKPSLTGCSRASWRARSSLESRVEVKYSQGRPAALAICSAALRMRPVSWME